MALELLLIIITIVALLIASYSDIKTKEVPDWLNYSLIFAALGVRAIFSFELGWQLIVSGILGLVVCLALAFLFYYAGQWGGGDSKLLMGMGAVVGITYPLDSSSLSLFWFLLALLFLGAVYSLLWMAVVAFRKKKIFFGKFKSFLGEQKKLHFFLIFLTVFFIATSFIQTILLLLAIFPLGLFYLFSFVSTMEKSCFLKKVKTGKLTEGDWLAENVMVDGKLVMRKKTLEKGNIQKLRLLARNNKVRTVLVKEGVPFVPSFLFAYLFLVFGGEVYQRLIELFFA